MGPRRVIAPVGSRFVPTALVTGGAGFIGSHVADALLRAGNRVIALDDLSTGRRENLAGALAQGAELVVADIRAARAVDEAFAAARPEAVYHLAAQVSVTRSVREVTADASINVVGTATVLEAARAAGVARFVHVSTGGALYGDTDRLPTPEDAPVRPLSPYGQSKWAAEAYCDLFARLHGLSTVTLRLANVYGPRQDPHGEAGVVAIFCERRRRGERPTVYGDGTQTRDYTYVADVVEAVLAAGASGAGGAFNVGTGRESTVLDLVDLLREAGDGGDGFEPERAPPRAGEMLRSCLDPARAARELGWHAATGLREGLGATYESFAGVGEGRGRGG
jgi:UDP-glucose 4-epimerase